MGVEPSWVCQRSTACVGVTPCAAATSAITRSVSSSDRFASGLQLSVRMPCAAWKARKPTRVAVLSVGWYHGFGCEMGNDIFRPRDNLRKILSGFKGLFIRKAIYVTVNGKRCRVLGHIGMLHTVCDVTNVKCSLGDKAVLNINPLMLKGMDVVWR